MSRSRRARARARARWDRYQTRCARLAGGWSHHRVLPGWLLSAADSNHALVMRSDILEGIVATSCPYYRGHGACSSMPICREEPQCVTDEPLLGWMGGLWGSPPPSSGWS